MNPFTNPPMITFPCPKCGASLQVPDDHVGWSETCPKCQQDTIVPVPGQEPVPRPVGRAPHPRNESSESQWAVYGRQAVVVTGFALLMYCVCAPVGQLAALAGLALGIFAFLKTGSRSNLGKTLAVVAIIVNICLLILPFFIVAGGRDIPK